MVVAGRKNCNRVRIHSPVGGEKIRRVLRGAAPLQLCNSYQLLGAAHVLYQASD